jgi:hypothetical protein
VPAGHAVNQPPFPLVFNTAGNALDGFDVSGVSVGMEGEKASREGIICRYADRELGQRSKMVQMIHLWFQMKA